MGFHDGDDEDAPTSPPPAWGLPQNEVPVAVPLGVELLRTPDLAVVLVCAWVASTGVRLEGIGRIDPESDLSFFDTGSRRPSLDKGRILGVEFADGRRGADFPYGGDESPDAVIVRQQGSGGGSREIGLEWWVAPVPPPGPLTLVLRVPGLNPDESAVTIDATPLADARGRVTELWPWRLERGEPSEPSEGLDLPEGSWFRALLAPGS